MNFVALTTDSSPGREPDLDVQVAPNGTTPQYMYPNGSSPNRTRMRLVYMRLPRPGWYAAETSPESLDQYKSLDQYEGPITRAQ